MLIINQLFKLEVFVNEKIVETGEYKYIGKSNSGRWLRFINTKTRQLHPVRYTDFPINGVWMDGHFVKCILSSI